LTRADRGVFGAHRGFGPNPQRKIPNGLRFGPQPQGIERFGHDGRFVAIGLIRLIGRGRDGPLELHG
jgi:hypothetical protein